MSKNSLCIEYILSFNLKQSTFRHDIEILNQLLQSQQTPDNDALNELIEKKDALEKILNYEAEGAFIRARTNYRIDGEKPTKLFCALETQNGVQKYV